MISISIRNALLVVVVAVLGISGCGSRQGSPSTTTPQTFAVLEDIRKVAIGLTGPATTEIDITRNAFRITIAVTKSEAASTDVAVMENEASAIVAAVEKILPEKAELSTIQVISVAYVHRHGHGDTHTDDVFDFRKTQSGTFEHHIT